MNGAEFAADLLLTLFVFELIGLLLAYYVNPITASPSVAGITGYQAAIQNQANNLGGALNYNITGYYPIANGGFFSSVGNAIAGLANVLITFGNIIVRIVLTLINLFSLIFWGVALLVYLMFVFLPALLLSGNLGVFGFIFTLGYGIMLALIATYAVPAFLSIIGYIWGGRGGSK